MDGNEIREIPSEIELLVNLEILYLHDNPILTIKSGLEKCKSLKELSLDIFMILNTIQKPNSLAWYDPILKITFESKESHKNPFSVNSSKNIRTIRDYFEQTEKESIEIISYMHLIKVNEY